MKPQPPPIPIAVPCPKSWESMSGDSKRRFCSHCQLHVHNLSAMSAGERATFVADSGGRACIAYVVRPDGSMVTASRWGWLAVPFERFQWSAAALLAAALPFLFSACATRRTLGKPAPSATCDPSGKRPANEGPTVMMLGAPMPPAPAGDSGNRQN